MPILNTQTRLPFSADLFLTSLFLATLFSISAYLSTNSYINSFEWARYCDYVTAVIFIIVITVRYVRGTYGY